MNAKKYLSFIQLCFLVCPIFLAANVLAQSSTQRTEQSGEADLVHFGDVIDVDIVGGFEFDWRGKLTAEGYLDGLETFGEPVFGLCRTVDQIAADVARVYSKILKDPKVVVSIIDRSDRALVRLEGAVRTPTRFRIRRTVTLRELLVMAGGLIDSSSGEISIFRPKNLSCNNFGASSREAISARSPSPSDNISQTTIIKVSELIAGSKIANPQVLSGDLINVLTADPVYVIGAVNNPRPVHSREKMSLSRVIAMSGGLAKNADGGKVTIFRRDGAETKTIDVELDKIKSGETSDELLKPFDIIDVAAKGAQRRKYPPVTTRGENRQRTELPLRVVD